MSLSVITTTCATKRDAKRISDELIKRRLAACVKVSWVESAYWWKGEVEREKEALLAAMVDRKKAKRAMEHIRKVHPYDVPEVIETPVKSGNRDYARWVCEVSE